MPIDPRWMPLCVMKRIIVHWTAGTHRASTLDTAHYHLLVEGDGRLVRGDHPIDANAQTAGPRASHTLNCNTHSIGLAVCSMAGARERPFDAGPFPMTERQWDAMSEAAAELCERYGIPVTPQTVLAHGEVQANLNIEQRGKWDPLVLPWSPAQPRADVMHHFRESVRAHQARLRDGLSEPIPGPPTAPRDDRNTAAEGEATMPEDVTLTSTEFYRVLDAQTVTLEVITGNAQASGTALLLNGVPHPFVDRRGPQPIGSNLAGSVLNVNTIVRDINPATNHTSVIYELRGGVQPRQFPFAVDVSVEKGAAHYLIAFVFTNEVV